MINNNLKRFRIAYSDISVAFVRLNVNANVILKRNGLPHCL